jgi:hypothetical protein
VPFELLQTVRQLLHLYNQGKIHRGEKGVIYLPPPMIVAGTQIAVESNVIDEFGKRDQGFFVQVRQPTLDLEIFLLHARLAQQNFIRPGRNKPSVRVANDCHPKKIWRLENSPLCPIIQVQQRW